jgi:hypothetical protein
MGTAYQILAKFDYRAVINLAVLIANMGAYNFYFYELFYGSWDKIQAKALYYITTSCVLLYLVIDEMVGYSSDTHKQISLICKLSLWANFLLFALILYNVLSNPINYLYILNGSIFVLSCIILFASLKHDFYKD